MSTPTIDDLVVIAERTEAETMFRLQESAPPAVRQALGMAVARIGGGVAAAMRHDPAGGYWRKVLGLGLDEPVTAPLIDRVIAFFREQENESAVFQIAPDRLPADWEEIHAARGITGGGSWTKLLGEADRFVPGGSDLRIAPVEPAECAAAAGVLMEGFGMPGEDMTALFAALFARDDVLAYAAWDGDAMVSVSCVILHGESASFAGTATLPGYRGRGAQTALLSARAAAAADAGVRWFVVETGTPGPGEVNHSWNNLLRCGFTPLYERRNWIWRPPTAQ